MAHENADIEQSSYRFKRAVRAITCSKVPDQLWFLIFQREHITLVLRLTLYNQLASKAGRVWADATEREKSMTRQMTQEELVQQLKEGRDKGYYIRGNIPDDPAELKRITREMQKNVVYKEHAEDEIGVGTGGQELILRRYPSGEWNESTDRALGVYIGGQEWTALFREVLGCPEGPSLASDSVEKREEKRRLQFQESIPDYPMLGRIWDIYIDVSYQPEEIFRLRDECLRVKESTSNPMAIRGLEKLIAGCDAALKIGTGLLLTSE